MLPGVREAVALCKAQGLKSVSLRRRRCICWKKCWKCLNYATSLTRWLPPNICHTANRTPVYLDCAAKLGIAPMSCVALEDSVNGMIASKAARMRSIVVPEAENSRDPRFVLADVKLTSLQQLTVADLRG